MFSAKQIAETVKNFSKNSGINIKELRLGGSGGLVMLGYKETARDLDIEVSKEVFKIIKDKYPNSYCPKVYSEGHPLAPGVLQLCKFETELGDLEIMEESIPFEIETMETLGILHFNKKSSIDFKLWLGREKDIQHLQESGLA